MWVQTVIYVILKGQNAELFLDASHSFMDIVEPHNNVNVVPIYVILTEI